MIGSNPIFSTEQVLDTSKACFSKNSAKSLTRTALSSAVLPYTMPFVNTGKEPKRIPRNSSKFDEIAKNEWCVEFKYFDPDRDKIVRVALSKQLNRIKEYHEKLTAFQELQTSRS
ncbi:MAG: hypothetical protein ACYCZO_02315 [Daejeonella sp.]